MESLKENNRYRNQLCHQYICLISNLSKEKKVIEDNKVEILRLSDLLDDKRKQLFILESKVELGFILKNPLNAI